MSDSQLMFVSTTSTTPTVWTKVDNEICRFVLGCSGLCIYNKKKRGDICEDNHYLNCRLERSVLMTEAPVSLESVQAGTYI